MHHISNAVSAIKVGVIAKNLKVVVQNTKFVLETLRISENLGYIRGFVIKDKYQIIVLLKYSGKISAIKNINTVSTPGRRVYLKQKQIYFKLKKKDSGHYIISTSRGLMADEFALSACVGGEVVLKIK